MRAPQLAQEEPRQASCQGQGQTPTAARRLRLRLRQMLRLCLGGCSALRLRGRPVRVHPLLWGLRLLARQVMQSAPQLPLPLQLASGP